MSLNVSVRLARVEKLSRSCRSARRSRDEFDAVAETAEFADHLRGAALGAVFGHGGPAFLVGHALVEDLPDEPTEPMGDGANRLGVPEALSTRRISRLPFGARWL
jgi:hypothetical protein